MLELGRGSCIEEEKRTKVGRAVGRLLHKEAKTKRTVWEVSVEVCVSQAHLQRKSAGADACAGHSVRESKGAVWARLRVLTWTLGE